ncbi:MAG TPA: GDYXXLXY domain-containing protein [Polyangiaceae bacterium]|jgi:uncharacterized membrane-anchored protein|nr:GDYXXLXY domain-containing protein [Polyangiaceae bacterium]
MKAWVTASAVLFPVVILGAWVAQLEYGRRAGAEVVLNVSAYDPRDILSGHYLQYRVDYGIPACESRDANQREMCLCLGQPSADVPEVAQFAGECAAKPVGCGVFIRGHCEYQRFIAGIERYYIPEDYAQVLNRVPEGAQIKVRISSSGSAQVTDFLVGGKPLAEFVRQSRPAQ